MISPRRFYNWYIQPKIDGIRWAFQRAFRGYDDIDVIDFGYALNKHMLKIIKRFRAVNIGHPARLTEAEWSNILREFQEGLEAHEVLEEEGLNGLDVFTSEEREELYAKVKHSYELLAQYLDDLWC